MIKPSRPGVRHGRNLIAALVATLAFAATQQALSAAPARAENDEGNPCSDSPWSWFECEEVGGGGTGVGGGSGGGDPFEEWEVDAGGEDPFEEWELDTQDEPEVWTSDDGSVTIRDETPWETYERTTHEAELEVQREYAAAQLAAMTTANHDDTVVITDESGDEQFMRELSEANINRNRGLDAAVKAAWERYNSEVKRQQAHRQRQNAGHRRFKSRRGARR
jgi:hypothetical protein